MSIFHHLDQELRGAPDHILTLILFALAALAVVIAITGPRLAKAALAGWFAFP